MDRFVANTLRTLGLIVLAICVIALAAGLALLGLCFAALASVGHHGGATPQSNAFLYLGIAAGIGVLVGGIIGVGVLARIVFRETKLQDQDRRNAKLGEGEFQPPPPPAPLAPPATQPGTTITTPPGIPLSPVPQPRNLPDPAVHLSPASRAAIERLILAIAAQASAQFIVGVIEWLWAEPVPMRGFRLHGSLLLVWSLAAMVPYILLAVALRRRPGPTAFSFCLVIPGLRSFFGLFGQAASIIILLRTFHSGMPLLSAVPWAIDLLIFYLAWKAVRLTGIEPSPARLILSAIDIFLYSVSLSVIFLFLGYYWH
jgi:hypothetical protein